MVPFKNSSFVNESAQGWFQELAHYVFHAVSSTCRALIDICPCRALGRHTDTRESAILFFVSESVIKHSLSGETISGFINLLDTGILTPQMF